MAAKGPQFHGIYVFVEDIQRTISFYERLGLEVEVVSDTFARATWRNGLTLSFGTAELTRSYDPNWVAPGQPGSCTIGFDFESDADVDVTYKRLVAAGYTPHLEPCTPPWQARFAIVKDPDKNYVGLHGPRDLQADRQREQGHA
ncbi:MAG: VOC family protein [Leptolyngbyaceae cyanobacterium]